MKWNSNAPLELLSQMPQRLSKENLEKIQSVIDNDKMICSIMLGHDLCGDYAPFCALCDRSMKTPCAVAYIRMRQAEGNTLEFELPEDELKAKTEVKEEKVVKTEKTTVIAVEEKPRPKKKAVKRRIRIATLVRKSVR